MNEISIELQEVSPKDFFGTNDSNIDLIKKYFPKLKIVARGNQIKVYGDESMLEEFDKRIKETKEKAIEENAIILINKIKLKT